MIGRRVASSLVVLVLSATVARAQGLEIDHKAVGCIVVGKYPKMNACFTPAANLARSRVYFRPEGVAAWYYVDMKSEQPCFNGTLPKPGKKLVGKKIEYYIEAQNKAFEPARTAEFDPIVVKSAQECKKNVPVAPFLNNATVAVFPSVPAGFVGGSIGTAAVVGIVGAGAAAVGTTAVVVSNNNNDTTTTTVAVVVNSTTTTTTLPPTTTTTTLPKTNHAPSAVLTVKPDPPTGTGPLTVDFDLCKSTDPDGDPLSYFFDFGDGAKSSGSCNVSHTYSAGPFRGTGNARAADASYVAEASVVDPFGASQSRTRNVKVSTDCGTPKVDLEQTIDFCGGIDVTATTGGATSVTFCAVLTSNVNCSGGSGTPPVAPSPICAEGTASGNTYTASLNLSSSTGCYAFTALARNGCFNTATAGPKFAFNDCGSGTSLGRNGERTAAWSSELSIEGGRLQVVVNGASPAFPATGRGFGRAHLVDGENRIEAVVVASAGKPGLWRIEITPAEAILEGSLRVISGETVLLGASSATFRLSGREGERIVFTFLKK